MGVISRFWKSITTGYQLFLNTVEILKITYASNTTTITGSAISADDLRIYGNSVNGYPYFQIQGDQGIVLAFTAGYGIYFKSAGTDILQLAYTTDTQLNTFSDLNLFLNPSGTGKVKFGAYIAGAASDSTGYITIIDKDGNTRKLMVQA